jgi:hypothetical protein
MTHVYGLRVTDLQQAWLAAATTDHAVSLVDDTSHTIVMVDQKGHVVMRPQERRSEPDWLYRKAGS